jgi:hypothetical protein
VSYWFTPLPNSNFIVGLASNIFNLLKKLEAILIKLAFNSKLKAGVSFCKLSLYDESQKHCYNHLRDGVVVWNLWIQVQSSLIFLVPAVFNHLVSIF